MFYYDYENKVDFSELKGNICKDIIVKEDEIHFLLNDGTKYVLCHQQDCCENVYIESITGDMNDLIGEEILLAEEATSNKNPKGIKPKYQGSFTWTFYKLATRKGYVDIRWYGESNGYYSESVDCYHIKGD